MNTSSGLTDVSGIILAGVKSSRFGRNKALVDAAGLPLIQRVVDRLRLLVDEIVLVTDFPDEFAFLGLPMTGDIHRGVGTLGGLHAGLCAIHGEYGLAVGCDMPLLSAGLLRYMVSLCGGYDVVMPQVGEYYEPLHALYSKRCLPCIERAIRAGHRRMLRACDGMRVRYVQADEINAHDPHHLSFFNVNDAQDLLKMEALLSTEDSG